VTAKTSSKRVIRGLLDQAEATLNEERRVDQRIPYFRTVTVQFDDRSYSAFIREISASSIGLLHNLELPLKDIEVRVAGQREGFPVRIERCRPCGGGWYLSGGVLLDCD